MQIKDKLEFIDQWLFEFLTKECDAMPSRLSKLIANYYTDARVRKQYWKRLGIEMGEGTFANLGLKLVPNDHEVCVYIGKNVSIAPNVTFVCHSSANNGKEINEYSYVKEKLTKVGDIIVEDEVWIGASVTILPGVRVGRCSVIGAGSLVINDVEPYSVCLGTPVKRIRDLRTGERVK